jgi:chloramphenicol 3-O-phosphotransferase
MSVSKDIIFIHGAPGAGKSTIAQALHPRLNSPWFEFGWIPEFRQKGEATLSYAEEEQLSFENLCLVVGNYLHHGFRGILISDLRDPVMLQALRRFSRRDCLLVTLWLSDAEILKQRVLDDSRSSGYRDWQEALALNRLYCSRPMRPNELRIDVTACSVQQVVDRILDAVIFSDPT